MRRHPNLIACIGLFGVGSLLAGVGFSVAWLMGAPYFEHAVLSMLLSGTLVPYAVRLSDAIPSGDGGAA